MPLLEEALPALPLLLLLLLKTPNMPLWCRPNTGGPSSSSGGGGGGGFALPLPPGMKGNGGVAIALY